MTTKIEWARNADGSPGETWNPIRARHRSTHHTGWHCVKVSDGCRNCYAETMNIFRGTRERFRAGEDVKVYLDKKALQRALGWQKPRTVFVCSMSDLFGEWVPPMFLDRVFAAMAMRREHTFQVLTKRPQRATKYLKGVDCESDIWVAMSELGWWDPDDIANVAPPGSVIPAHPTWPLSNVHIGTSVEDQRNADERIPHLLACPAALRFLSVEPILGPVDLDGRSDPKRPGVQHQDYLNTGMDHCNFKHAIEWVIVGGESGTNARPAKVEWFRSLRDQCRAANVPFFLKQFGKVLGKELGIADSKGGGDMSLWPNAVQDLAIRETP